jgi:hypothetical protein
MGNDVDPKSKGDEFKFGSSNSEGEPIDIPAVEVFPLATYHQKYQLTSREVDALVKSNPEVILQLIQENQKQQKQTEEQEFELAKIRLSNEHEIKIKREENKLKSEQQNKNIIRLGIAAFCGIFAGALVYAARVDDKNLPNTIITAAISLLAGGSTSVIAFSRKEGGEEKGEKGQKNIEDPP